VRPVDDLEGGLLVTANSVSFLALSSNFWDIRWYKFALYLARRCRAMNIWRLHISKQTYFIQRQRVPECLNRSVRVCKGECA
jgi:hypothetical protein